jgi:hypothetical protein
MSKFVFIYSFIFSIFTLSFKINVLGHEPPAASTIKTDVQENIKSGLLIIALQLFILVTTEGLILYFTTKEVSSILYMSDLLYLFVFNKFKSLF